MVRKDKGFIQLLVLFAIIMYIVLGIINPIVNRRLSPSEAFSKFVCRPIPKSVTDKKWTGRSVGSGRTGLFFTSRLMRWIYHQFSIPSRSKKYQNSNILVAAIFRGNILAWDTSKVFHFTRKQAHHLPPNGLNYRIGKIQKFIYIWLEISSGCVS